MAAMPFNEAFRTHEFTVEIEGMESPGITKVSGISEGDVDAIDQPDGGDNITHKISSGIVKYDDITLERHMDGSQADEDFRLWFSEMFNLDGTGGGSQLRRNGSVVVKRNGEEVLRFAFEGAWIKSSKFADLDASSDALFLQTIVMAVERMYRVT